MPLERRHWWWIAESICMGFFLLRPVLSWHCWGTCTLTISAASLAKMFCWLYYTGDYQTLNGQLYRSNLVEVETILTVFYCLLMDILQKHLACPTPLQPFKSYLCSPRTRKSPSTHKLCAQRPSCSWRSPGGSRPHTGTNSLLARGSPPPAAWWRW